MSVELFKDDTYGVTRGIQCDTVFKDDTYGVTRDTYGVTHTVSHEDSPLKYTHASMQQPHAPGHQTLYNNEATCSTV